MGATKPVQVVNPEAREEQLSASSGTAQSSSSSVAVRPEVKRSVEPPLERPPEPKGPPPKGASSSSSRKTSENKRRRPRAYLPDTALLIDRDFRIAEGRPGHGDIPPEAVWQEVP